MLSFVTPVAYDWALLRRSIPAYYGAADEILIGLDRDRVSWAGVRFDLDVRALEELLGELDPAGKIRLVEGDFHSERSPRANDTMERETLAHGCRAGNWIVEVDADEILSDVHLVEAALAGAEPGCQWFGLWLDIVKREGDVALVARPQLHFAPLATMSRQRTRFRFTGEPVRIFDGLQVEHLTLARSEADVAQKLRSWGHAQDFDPGAYLERWRGLSAAAHQSARDVYHVTPSIWPRLEAVPASSLRWLRE